MSLKFFSQFLLVEEIVTEEQLDKAVETAGVAHKTLGQLAVSAGFLTDKDAIELNQEQMKHDIPFGALAIQKGLLTEDQLGDLITQQGRQHLSLADSLVKLGFLKEDQLDGVLAAYHVARSGGHGKYLEGLEGLEKNRVAEFVVESFPRMTMRLARIHVKINNGQSLGSLSLKPFSASIDLGGEGGVRVGLSSDGELACEIIRGMTRIMAGDEDIQFGQEKGDYEDLLGGFLDIVAGHAVASLESEGIRLEMGTPEFADFGTAGYGFELTSTSGQAVLVIQQL